MGLLSVEHYSKKTSERQWRRRKPKTHSRNLTVGAFTFIQFQLDLVRNMKYARLYSNYIHRIRAE